MLLAKSQVLHRKYGEAVEQAQETLEVTLCANGSAPIAAHVTGQVNMLRSSLANGKQLISNIHSTL